MRRAQLLSIDEIVLLQGYLEWVFVDEWQASLLRVKHQYVCWYKTVILASLIVNMAVF